jgi:hypothetical protein
MPPLDAANKRWDDFLRQDGAPPLVGLVPMSETERAQVAADSHAWMGGNSSRWQRLFEVYPASTFAWFGCAAGSAYSEGTFWPKFEDQTGLVGAFASHASRRDLVGWCHRVARSFGMPLPPETDGTVSPVSALLFFGGFPSCHSATFAREVRAIQRNNELPDPDAEDAGEELCELLQWRLRNLPVPRLKRALAGPAGSIVCEAALSVLFSGDFTQINPHVGDELRIAFENVRPVRGSATFRSPYLRLTSDLLSLEIVCPAQDATLLRERLMRWVIDGEAHLCSPQEDFVVPVSAGKTACQVEAAGLVSARTIVRDVRLPSNPMEVWVFSGGTRKLRKVFDLSGKSATIQCGDYHVLYPANGTWGDGAFHWPAFSDSWLARSVDCRPAQSFSLAAGSARWTLSGAATPSVWPEGTCFASGEGQRIFYGQLSLCVWWPGSDAINSHEWEVEVRSGDNSRRLGLDQATSSAEGTTTSINLNDVLSEMLPAGVTVFQVSLHNKGRRQATREVAFWKGLEEYKEKPQVFRVSTSPENLDPAQSVGFDMGPEIRAVQDGRPLRRLAFHQGGGQLFVLSWRNTGTFLESFDREPGVPAQPGHHKLGSTFAASLNSRKFLRVWSDTGFETLAINGLPEGREGRGGSVELSLAELSTRFPQGGGISLGGRNVAGFTSPLVPLRVSRVSGDGSRGLDFVLREKVAGVRIVLQEMIGQTVTTTPVHWFGDSDSVKVEHAGMPSVTLACRDGETSGEFHVAIQAPLDGWPLGVWLLSVEVCRRTTDQPEGVVFAKGQRSPLLVLSQPEKGDDDAAPLISVLSKVWRKSCLGDLVNEELDISDHLKLVPEMLGFLRRWHRFFESGVSGGIDKDFEWIKFLEKAIAQLGEKRIREGENEGAHWLLSLANTHGGKRRLLRTPEVLCLPATEYSDLPEGDPLLDALGQLNWLSGFDLCCDAVCDQPAKFAQEFLMRFENYGQIAGGELEEFAKFNLSGFWHEINAGGYALDAPRPQDQLLGKDHWKWAVAKFSERYVKTADKPDAAWGYAMSCLMNGPKPILSGLRQATEGKVALPPGVWQATSPLLSTGNAAMEVTPRFCSTWALANRLVADRKITFGPVYQLLIQAAGNEYNCRAGLRVLLEACPELFAFFLLFWEFQIKVHPYQ